MPPYSNPIRFTCLRFRPQHAQDRVLPLLKLSKAIDNICNTKQVDLSAVAYSESYDIAAFRRYALGNSGWRLICSRTNVAQRHSCKRGRLRSPGMWGPHRRECRSGCGRFQGREDNAALMAEFFTAAAASVRSTAQGRPSANAAQERRES